jgi:AbrB family looped-hinge helix DNA binding protein
VSGIFAVVVGDRGRFVIPSEVRDAAGIEEGTRLMLLPTAAGLVLMTREQLKARVRADLAGHDLVGELLDARREASVEEDRV